MAPVRDGQLPALDRLDRIDLTPAPMGPRRVVVLWHAPRDSARAFTIESREAGSLREINSDDVNICTVEDPVEFNLAWVNQFQVNVKAGFTFASALRSLLRQDPDIIMVGEIRDSETARIAVQAALTGHLVLSTLHTNDAPSGVTRLLNIGIEPYLVAASVEAILAQRLVRKICTHCKESYEPPINIRRSVEKHAGQVESFYHGVGCPKCRNTGFFGRIGIYELMVMNDEVRDKISANASINELRAIAKANGMVTLHQDGMAKAKLLLLAHIRYLGQIGDGADLAKHVDVAARLQELLQLQVQVEVILDRPLLAAGHDDDLLDAGSDCFLDRVLDNRLVDEGKHLLGLGLGGRKEPGAPTRSRKDSLADAHLPQPAAASSAAGWTNS